MCQGCVNEGRITQKVYDAIKAFETRWPDSAYGPAHIVIADENVGDDSIQWCLDNWDRNAAAHEDAALREQEFTETRVFLAELLGWRIEDREP